jgi:hypothetical protein
MRAPTRGLAKALRSIYWGGRGGPALPPARSVRPACGVYKTRQDKSAKTQHLTVRVLGLEDSQHFRPVQGYAYTYYTVEASG